MILTLPTLIRLLQVLLLTHQQHVSCRASVAPSSTTTTTASVSSTSSALSMKTSTASLKTAASRGSVVPTIRPGWSTNPVRQAVMPSTTVVRTQMTHTDDTMEPPPHARALRNGTTEPPRSRPSSSAATTTLNAAILLNANARRVNDKVVQAARDVFGAENVFATSTREEAQAAARAIVCEQRSRRMVIVVGGDGTLTATLQELVEAQESQTKNSAATGAASSLDDRVAQLPVVAYIPFGTGNAVGSAVGYKPKGRRRKHLLQLFRDLKDVSDTTTSPEELLPTAKNDSPQQPHSLIELPILHVTTSKDPTSHELCFFCGVGFDSLMLDDFKQIKAWSNRTGILPRLLGSVAGYCVALVTKTLPAAIRHQRHNVHVTVTSHDPERCLWVDHRRGDFVQPVKNKIVYDGESGITCAGTVPYYGGGLRLFPFARMTPDRMHLRIARIHPVTGFFNIPRIFAGSYRNQDMDVLDFMGKDFEVQLGTSFPVQHSGESLGKAESFRLRVVKAPIRFLSGLPSR